NKIQNLNSILITSPELSDLRKRLKNLETKDVSRSINSFSDGASKAREDQKTSQPTRNRRIRGDRTSLPASNSNLSQSTTSISNKNNSGSTDQRGSASSNSVNVNTGTSGSLQADQPKRRLSAASSTSATSDHGSGSAYSRSQSPPVNVKR
ncbi:3141_t:CDS:2, partial [Racocetra fulgida]